MVLLALIWPINPRWRERDSVARVFHSLAGLLNRLPQGGPEVVPEAAALQEAWSVLGEARGHGWHTEHALMLHALRVAEGVRAALVGYAQADQHWRDHSAEGAEQARKTASALVVVLNQVENSVRAGQPGFAPTSQQAISNLLTDLNGWQANELNEWVRLIQQLLEELNHPPVTPPDATETIPPPTVHSALLNVPRPTWNSPATRHAVKYGLVLGLGTLLTRLLNVPHGYWLVLTAAVVLRQEYVTTLTRGLARLGGTLAGVLLAELLVLLLHPDHNGLAWLSLVGAFMAFALFPTGYLAFSGALTLYVVFAIAASGLSSGLVMELRLLLTVLGGLLALFAYLLYPTWQSIGTRRALEDAMQAQLGYLNAVGELRRNYSTQNIYIASQARASARQSRLQAEGIVQASSLEPRRSLRAYPDALLPEQAQAYLKRLNANAALALSLHARAGNDSVTAQDQGFISSEFKKAD